MLTEEVKTNRVTRLQDKCPDCGKVAVEKFSINTTDKDGNQVKLITLECFHIIKKVIPRATPFESMISNDWKPEIKNCKHTFLSKDEAKEQHKPSNQCTKCGEFKLYQFQIDGAKHIESALACQKGFGLFDDMGLGKTVQDLAVIKFHPEYTPTLYIVKSAITFNWFKQIIRWLGPDYLPLIIKTGRDSIIPGLKSYVISYDLLRRIDRSKIEKLGIKLIVLDECQQIKNADSARTQEVRKLVGNPTTKVIGTSGTPWKNRGSEYFPILNMIDPIKFHSNQSFLDTWVEYYWQGSKRKMGGIKNIPKFKEYTTGMLIRREYNEVMTEFPDINRMKLNVQLDALGQTTYDEAVSDFVKWYNSAIIDGVEDKLSGLEILAKMSRMRHLTGLAKIPATLGFTEEFIEDTDRKLVIFVHHIDVGTIILDNLTNMSREANPDWYHLANLIKKEGIQVYKISGSMNDGEKFTVAESFNRARRAIMVASTLAAGEGMDLQTCSDCVMHERQWNPQNEEQAAPGRFRRIGQVSSVINITYTEAEDTIDQHIDSLIENKRKSFHDAMNKSEMVKWSESDMAKQLADIIVKKHNSRRSTKQSIQVA